VTVIRQMAPRSTTRCAKHYADGRPTSQFSPFRLPVGEGDQGQGGDLRTQTPGLGSETVQHRRRQRSRPYDRQTHRQANRQTNFPWIV